jgi:hypothetical protein
MTRPADVWRVCGKPVTGKPGCGCTCTPRDPSAYLARKALDRLGAPDDEQEEGPGASRSPRTVPARQEDR